MRPNCANICNLAYTDNLYENLQTRQKYLNAKYNSLEIFLARNSSRTVIDISKPWQYNERVYFWKSWTNDCFWTKRSIFTVVDIFLSMERVPRVGGGIRGSAALKSAQCRKLYFGICCFAQMKTLEFVFWSRNKAICPHHTCLLLFVIFLFFPMAFTAIKSQCSPQGSTFTFQDGGSVPAKLPADGCTVDGGGREHQGAVQWLHWGRQVSLRVLSRFKTWWEQSSIQFQY